MVGHDAGGATDAHARYMARDLPEFIPGNPRIEIRNLTPNVAERNFVWDAEPDGLTLALEATPGVLEQFIPPARFDMRQVTMIGVVSGREEAWFIRGTLPYNCIDDAFGASHPDLTIAANARTPADRALWLAMRPDIAMSHNIIGPPGMPAELTQALRDALTAAMADEQFPQNMERFTGIPTNFIDGATAQQELIEIVDKFIANKGEVDLIARDVYATYVR